MAKEQSPGAVFKSYMDQYNLTAAKIAADIKLSQSSIRLLIGGKLKISVPIALRLSRYFGNKPEFWIDLQNTYELAEAARNPKLSAIFKAIPKAKKQEAKAPAKAPVKPAARTARKPAGKPAAKPRAAK
ncbi:MAG: HigA family addiction module antidote protein [Treponema sp.]|jgi:addiction module HigA family antidote|nr:HigA family addiction module antidote protein [Treponema sp.]